MKEFTYTIKDSVGIHARPAGLLVKCASMFKSEILLTKGEKCVDAKKIFSVMTLGAKQGDEVTVKINGSDDVVSTVYSNYNWANSHTFKVSKPATYLLFTDSGIDMAKLKVFADNVVSLNQMLGTTIQSATLNTSTMEVTVTVNNKGLCAIRLM